MTGRAASALRAAVYVAGGGLGGVSAAGALAERGWSVIMTEPTDWIGGQLTSQLVPLDEHRHIERTGANASYRRLRDGIRDYYRRHFPLTEAARHDPYLNPGHAWVSPVSADPRVGVAVLEAMLAPHLASGRITLLRRHEPVAVHVAGDRVAGVQVRDRESGDLREIEAAFVLDATELGDLLPLAGVEHVSGREARAQTGEPSAPETADPTDMQAVTWCFAVEHLEGEDHTIDRPATYDFYRTWEPEPWHGGRILDFGGPAEHRGPRRRYTLTINPKDAEIDLDHRNMGPTPELWTYRRIAAREMFRDGAFRSDITVVNWPMNDYVGGPLFGVPDAQSRWEGARQLSLSLLYWLQTEAPRPDGGVGWPGLRLRADVAGTSDGLAKMPYVRESRRIAARRTIVEQDVDRAFRDGRGAERYPDSVGVGHYFWIDRHASTGGRTGSGGLPEPFEIPLAALVPVRVRNLLPAAKNIGTTQITNGCYRLHPVEWSIGEAAGTLAAYCLGTDTEPHQVSETPSHIAALQRDLVSAGAQLHWAGETW
ncbi:FAD-dependent oxidoreductase [Nocardioides sp. KR10-350]|uniref:FAD-dependent oxidoreductase n=1 Tax=Nocardioides cheoyonin TaxID=3156615 RepID=UPI0032B37AA9